MGHNLRAIIGRPPAIEALAHRFTAAVRVPLPQGLEMVPLVDELCNELAFTPEAGNPESADEGFSSLGSNAEHVLADLSRIAPVAYIYTEYFGGVGDQAAVAFVDGSLATRNHGSKRALAWSSTVGPINSALAVLGVVRGGDEDEFAALALWRYRDTDEAAREE